MAELSSGLATLLFTDLVNSTELLSRAGDVEAQRIFRAHHDLLAEAAAAHGGEEVKWLGDGLMVAFPSASDAVRCAIAMQQASRQPIHGEHLAIRVGLNAGEVLREAMDYFGLTVVVARRLCDRAEAGQIFATQVVTDLLAGRAGFSFAGRGKLELKGVPDAVAAFEVRYEEESGAALPTRMPFVGREAEFRRLSGQLADVAAGRGGLALLAGEPGIGKTRLAEELADAARRQGMEVLWGRCVEGEWAAPYAPFVEAIEALAGAVTTEELRADLGAGAGPLGHLVPRLRQLLPDVPELVPVQPDEERFRVIDAVAQLLLARSERTPLLLVLDDLHWADKGTVAMLRQVARFASQRRLLILGTFRDVEVGRGHPLAEALDSLRREADFDRVRLEGLEPQAVRRLLAAVADHEVSRSVGGAIATETEGNPLFIREVVRHLVEEGKVYRRPDGRWTSDLASGELGIPEGVREVIDRRLSRLPEAAHRLLGAACSFEAEFQFDIVAAVCDLSENDALDALDEALKAQLIQPAAGADTYAFSHALIRSTLYADLSPSRRVRLHRRLAEALWSAYGSDLSPARAGEIASQYHRSAGLPGAEKGVEPAMVAADHAESTGAHDEAARFLRMALDVLPAADVRRPRLLSRLGIALAWALAFEEACETARAAGAAIADTEGAEAAGEYLADAAYACSIAGGAPYSWKLAPEGLAYTRTRGVHWARLISFEFERRAAEDPEHPGIPFDTPERREAAGVLRRARLDVLGPAPMEAVFDSRTEAEESGNLIVLTLNAGAFARCLPLSEDSALEAESSGRLSRAARAWSNVAYCSATLGQLDRARAALDRAQDLSQRLGAPLPNVLYAQQTLAQATDEGWEQLAGPFEAFVALTAPALAWGQGYLRGAATQIAARLGRTQDVLRHLERLVPWLERAPAWAIAFPSIPVNAAEALWLLDRLDHADLVEWALREKVLPPDFRYPMMDGRIALARICALTGRHEEARSWFAEARTVLTEQGARPLLAIADYDEALMHVRRRDPGDLDRAGPLLEAARQQFEGIGMTGWIRRADELRRGW